jgi:hypothetical protein
VEVNVASGDARRGVRGVRLEQPVETLRDLERLPHAARDDGEVVGGVAELSAFPVDDRGRRVRVEQDVLAEEIAVEERGGLLGR